MALDGVGTLRLSPQQLFLPIFSPEHEERNAAAKHITGLLRSGLEKTRLKLKRMKRHATFIAQLAASCPFADTRAIFVDFLEWLRKFASNVPDTAIEDGGSPASAPSISNLFRPLDVHRWYSPSSFLPLESVPAVPTQSASSSTDGVNAAAAAVSSPRSWNGNNDHMGSGAGDEQEEDAPDPDLLLEDIWMATGQISHIDRLLAWHPTYLAQFKTTMQLVMVEDGPLPIHFRHYIACMAAARFRCTYIVRQQEAKFLAAGGPPSWLKSMKNAPRKIRRLLTLNALLAHQPWLVSKRDIARLVVRRRKDDGEDDPAWSISELVHACVIASLFHGLSGLVMGLGLNVEISTMTLEEIHALHAVVEEKQSGSDEASACAAGSDRNHGDRLAEMLVGGEACALPRGDMASFKLAIGSEDQILSDDIIQPGLLDLSALVWDRYLLSSADYEEAVLNTPLDSKPEEAAAGAHASGEAQDQVEDELDDWSDSEEMLEDVERKANEGSEKVSRKERRRRKREAWDELRNNLRTMTYKDFDVNSQLYSIFREHTFTWEQHGRALLDTFYQGVGPLLSDQFRLITDLTYHNVADSQEACDTSPFRHSVLAYVSRLFGILSDDYLYGQIPKYLMPPVKNFVFKVACRPGLVSKQDWEMSGYSFRDDEKVHIALLTFEARRQAGLLYALAAIERYNVSKSRQD